MHHDNIVEVILTFNRCLTDRCEKELINWLATTAQPAVGKQQANVKKKYLKNWKNTPAIYLS